MIYITGDTHSDFSRFNTKNFPKQKELTKDDYVIICGDFGGVWYYKGETKEEKHKLDWLEKKPYTTLFVDGNHECFDRLYDYPVEEWHGGKIHRIRPSVIHLMRGQVYEIDGNKIFAFGGAKSHDISGGLLDPEDPDFDSKYKELRHGWEPFRIIGMSWWDRELPDKEEMFEGLKNLGKYDYDVDYIITHCTSTEIQDLVRPGGLYVSDNLTDYFNDIRNRCKYKKWYFGHYHKECNVTYEDVLLYERIVKLGDNVNEHMPGKPIYMMGDKVKFLVNKDGTMEEIEGRISVVDAYGTFEQQEEPSYDILVRTDGSYGTLYKHIRESNIHF